MGGIGDSDYTIVASESNLEAVDEFLKYAARASARRLAMEFRDRSCFGEEMQAVLRKHCAALVISHSSRYPAREVEATSDLIYFRFHGPREMFASSYSDAELQCWAKAMKRFLKRRRDLYAYFNNDAGTGLRETPKFCWGTSNPREIPYCIELRTSLGFYLLIVND